MRILLSLIWRLRTLARGGLRLHQLGPKVFYLPMEFIIVFEDATLILLVANVCFSNECAISNPGQLTNHLFVIRRLTLDISLSCVCSKTKQEPAPEPLNQILYTHSAVARSTVSPHPLVARSSSSTYLI